MTGGFNALLRAIYSTATAESVGSFLAAWYELPGPLECALLHRGFNDSFEVRAADGQRYVLRLSCRRPRGDADVASETEFLTYLDRVGVPAEWLAKQVDIMQAWEDDKLSSGLL